MCQFYYFCFINIDEGLNGKLYQEIVEICGGVGLKWDGYVVID